MNNSLTNLGHKQQIRFNPKITFMMLEIVKMNLMKELNQELKNYWNSI